LLKDPDRPDVEDIVRRRFKLLGEDFPAWLPDLGAFFLSDVLMFGSDSEFELDKHD